MGGGEYWDPPVSELFQGTLFYKTSQNLTSQALKPFRFRVFVCGLAFWGYGFRVYGFDLV